MTDVEAVEEKIARLCGWFWQQVAFALRLAVSPAGDSSDNNAPVSQYRRLVLLSLIDALAGIRFDQTNHPKLNGANQERFTRLIREYGDWPDGALISLPVLLARLKQELPGSGLALAISGRIERRHIATGHVPMLSEIDEPLDAVLATASTQRERDLIQQSQHYHLLYKYRTYLVHELRTPGGGMDAFGEDAGGPCYH